MKVTGILLDVDSNPGSVKISDIEEENLDEFYKALNCNMIDIVVRDIDGRKFNIVCDDEGLLRESPNVSAIGTDGKFMLVGNLFICNNYKEHLTSLSGDDIQFLMTHFITASFVRHKSKDFKTHPILTDVSYSLQM